MTMKITKYQPGSYLEVDDLSGGRKVVAVGRDGVTFWDSVDSQAAEKTTPLIIHESTNVVELGTMTRFAIDNGLDSRLPDIIKHLEDKGLPPDAYTLNFMRVLWELASDRSLLENNDYGVAIERAAAQEQRAINIHKHIENYATQVGVENG